MESSLAILGSVQSGEGAQHGGTDEREFRCAGDQCGRDGAGRFLESGLRAVEPVLEAAAARHPEVRFAKLNAADYPDIAWAFKVVSVPTLVLFREGVPVDEIVGAVPAQRIEELLVESGREGGGA